MMWAARLANRSSPSSAAAAASHAPIAAQARTSISMTRLIACKSETTAGGS